MAGTLNATVVGILGGKDIACSSLGLAQGVTLGDAGKLLCGTVVIARSSVGELGGSWVLVVLRDFGVEIECGLSFCVQRKLVGGNRLVSVNYVVGI